MGGEVPAEVVCVILNIVIFVIIIIIMKGEDIPAEVVRDGARHDQSVDQVVAGGEG